MMGVVIVIREIWIEIKNIRASCEIYLVLIKQVMTIADLRTFVIVEIQHVHFLDFGLWPESFLLTSSQS